MKKSNSRLLTLILVCLFAITIGSIAYATSTRWRVTLYPAMTNATLINAEKSTYSDYATNRIDSMGGNYNAMNVWVGLNGRAIYGKATQYRGQGTYTMPFGRRLSPGTQLEVLAENAKFTYVRVEANGYCDIK